MTATDQQTSAGAAPSSFKKHTLSLYVANKPGVLIRIALVFARRAYNVDSLVVSPSADPDFSRMNIVASGDEKVLDQILKQLNKADVEIVELGNAERQRFADAVQPLIEAQRARFGDRLFQHLA